jgi:hypothetical protein
MLKEEREKLDKKVGLSEEELAARVKGDFSQSA